MCTHEYYVRKYRLRRDVYTHFAALFPTISTRTPLLSGLNPPAKPSHVISMSFSESPDHTRNGKIELGVCKAMGVKSSLVSMSNGLPKKPRVGSKRKEGMDAIGETHCKPIHALLPFEKGTTYFSRRWRFPSPIQRCGSNLCGFVKMLGSRCMKCVVILTEVCLHCQ